MSLGQMIFVVVIILIIAILVLFPSSRKLVKAFINLFIKDMASTPEGARALYEEKIDEAKEAYAKADDALARASGKLSNAKSDLENLKKQLKTVEKQCEQFIERDKEDLAILKAEEREDILADIHRVEQLIVAYTSATEEAKDLHTKCEVSLKKLQREAKEVVENMKVKTQIKEVYDNMNELKSSTTTDKLLESIKEKNNSLNEIAEGAKVVHENRLSTRLDKANNEARKLQSNDYIESLKKKYNK